MDPVSFNVFLPRVLFLQGNLLYSDEFPRVDDLLFIFFNFTKYRILRQDQINIHMLLVESIVIYCWYVCK